MRTLNICTIGKANESFDWIKAHFSDRIEAETFVSDWGVPEPYTLYCVDINWNPLRSIPRSFLDAASATPGVGLFHADEWLIEDYSVYRHFAFVIRVFRTAAISGPGILTLPLGWPNGGEGSGMGKPASLRQYSWFFSGNLISSRPEMVKAMSTVPGGYNLAFDRPAGSPALLDIGTYRQMLGNTCFVPAGMGNVVLETWRFYEALEYGCIPIVEKRPFLDYYRGLLGDHPLPAFRDWREAARFVEGCMASPADLDALQARVFNWWTAYKTKLQAEAQAFIEAGLNDEFRPQLRNFAFSTGWRKTLWQYSELLRHQSLQSLGRRVRKALGRGSLRRDMSHLEQG